MSTQHHSKSHPLTQAFCKALPVPEMGRPVYYDRDIKGLGIRVTPKGTKTWILLRRVNGKARLMTLGQFPGLTAPKARTAAEGKIGEIAGGVDPVEKKRQARQAATQQQTETYALSDAWDDFKEIRGAMMRPRVLQQYERDIHRVFADWMQKPIGSITYEMVISRHRNATESGGEQIANKALRELRAVLNLATRRKRTPDGPPLLAENPVGVITAMKAWHRNLRRQTVIKEHELPAFWNAARSLRDDLVDDLMVVLLLTGLRKMEAASLTWENVDLRERTLHVPDPKNRNPHTVPMGEYLTDLMWARKERVGDSMWVFRGRKGHLQGFPEKLQRLYDAFGRRFLIHDLRRTFQTTVESLDISWLVAKKLLNHSVAHDVTAGYVVLDTERLRKPMQQVEDKLLAMAGVRPGGEVIEMSRRRKGGGK